MNISNTLPNEENQAESPSVDVLTSRKTGNSIGHRLGGGRPGPNVLVAGHAPQIDYLFERLVELPTLPWMWGKLHLVTLERLDEEYAGGPLKPFSDISFDETIMLPYINAKDYEPSHTDKNYWVVLRACADLGMIAGRGIN